MSYQIQCRHFTGYKPCDKNTECHSRCPSLSIPEHRILVIHLGALGAVVRATSVLPAIHRQYPNAHITWVTDRPADQLLKNISQIDRVLTSQDSDLLTLSALEFDQAFVIDKSIKASGILARTKTKELFGFKVDPRTGAILPATTEAEELWNLGLNNYEKFFVNKKAETQLMIEALNLGKFQRDEYQLQLSPMEMLESKNKRQEWLDHKKWIVGLNTGCSGVIAHKKLSVSFQREIIRELSKNTDIQIVLLGGPEDTERNLQIAKDFEEVISSNTTLGLRDGLTSVDACDIVITGDSLGMHLAIAQKKWTVAWFGPTCAHEIDLYDRGHFVMTQAKCSPCWKRSCQKDVMCYDQVELKDILDGVFQGIEFCKKSSLSKQHLSEISSSPSL